MVQRHPCHRPAGKTTHPQSETSPVHSAPALHLARVCPKELRATAHMPHMHGNSFLILAVIGTVFADAECEK